jgi:hypothetical protein
MHAFEIKIIEQNMINLVMQHLIIHMVVPVVVLIKEIHLVDLTLEIYLKIFLVVVLEALEDHMDHLEIKQDQEKVQIVFMA